ncbi:hypothetical protein PS2_004392 [Malus domestica]
MPRTAATSRLRDRRPEESTHAGALEHLSVMAVADLKLAGFQIKMEARISTSEAGFASTFSIFLLQELQRPRLHWVFRRIPLSFKVLERVELVDSVTRFHQTVLLTTSPTPPPHLQPHSTRPSSSWPSPTALSPLPSPAATAHALKVFEEMPEQNWASLNAVITQFLQNGYCREALRLFKNVWVGGFKPNSVTIASMISACGSAEQGMEMHCLVVKLGVDSDVYVGTSFLTMYSNCGKLVLAEKVFEEMAIKNVVSYNAFVSGLLQNGVPHVALDVFKQMRPWS